VEKGWREEGRAQGQNLISSPQRQLFLACVYCQLHRLAVAGKERVGWGGQFRARGRP